MTEKYTVEESTKRILERIDPIDSLMFDVGVARHQMMVGDLDTALRYLGPDGALHELRKCLMANFVDPNEFYEIQKDIERNIQAIESYKSTGDENEFYEALKVLDALHLWLMKKAYSAFKKLDPGSNPSHDFGAWFVPILFIIMFVGLPLGWWALTSTFPPAEKRGLV